MGTPATVDWDLFVDESGNFEDADDDATVCGLLVRAGLPGTRPPELRTSLQGVLPFLPWPFHARLYNRPAFLGIVAARDDESSKRWAEAGRHAVAWFEAHSPRELAAVIGALDGGKEPQHDDVVALDDALRRSDRALYRELRALRRHVYAHFEAILTELAVLAGSDRDPAIALLATGEPRRDDGEGGGDERYRGHLQCLLERAADVLRRRGGSHRIWVHVLTRYVHEPVLDRRVPMHIRHVAPLAFAVSGGEVRVAVASVPRYDDAVHPALVLADRAANRARPVLARDQALAKVETALRQALKLPVRSGHPSVSHVAATGSASRYIAGEVDRMPSDARRWTVDQAEEWIAAARGGGR